MKKGLIALLLVSIGLVLLYTKTRNIYDPHAWYDAESWAKYVERWETEVHPWIEFQSRSALEKIELSCKPDLEASCKASTTAYESMECIKLNRARVEEACEMALRSVIGGEPFEKVQTYKGVELPAGSYFRYDPRSGGQRIWGAEVPANFTHDGVEYLAGTVRFNNSGLGSANLAKDQMIDGRVYTAGTVIRFGWDGSVQSESEYIESRKLRRSSDLAAPKQSSTSTPP